LALSTTLTSDSPDNLIRTILEGIQQPASSSLGFMPPFKEALDDAQIIELVRYMRARFAPEKFAWGDLAKKLEVARASQN
jgi:nicotinate dehydrogenase subunit B